MLWKHVQYRKRYSVPLGALDRKDRQTMDCGEQSGLDQYKFKKIGGEVCRWTKQEGLKMGNRFQGIWRRKGILVRPRDFSAEASHSLTQILYFGISYT